MKRIKDKGYDFSKSSVTKKDIFPSTLIKKMHTEGIDSAINTSRRIKVQEENMKIWEIPDYEKFVKAKNTMKAIKDSFKELPTEIKREFNDNADLYLETVITANQLGKTEDLKKNLTRSIMMKKAEENRFKEFQEWKKNDQATKNDNPKE